MKDLKGLTKKGLEGIKKAFVYGSAAFTMASMVAVPASAVTIKTNVTTDKVVGGLLDIVFKVATYVGIVIAVIGIFMFLYSFKDDNAESQGRGARLAIVGMALVGLQPLVKLTGLIG